MHLFSTLLYAISANLDCLSIAIAYGIKETRICFLYNLMIAFISSMGTFISMKIGYMITQYIPLQIANHLGSIMISMIGMMMIIKYFIDYHSTSMQTPQIQELTFKEVLFLAIALSINNVALSIGTSITGVPILSATLCSFIFSIIFCALGQKIGSSYLSQILGKYSSVIAGLILLVLGIYEMFI